MRGPELLLRFPSAPFLVACGLLLLTGCPGPSTAGTGDGASSPYILEVEPDGAVTPTEAKESHASAGPIVLIGRVDAGEFDPFEAGKATFVLSEAPDDEHAGGDPNHVDNCPFCQRKLKNAPKAVVRFVGARSTASHPTSSWI